MKWFSKYLIQHSHSINNNLKHLEWWSKLKNGLHLQDLENYFISFSFSLVQHIVCLSATNLELLIIWVGSRFFQVFQTVKKEKSLNKFQQKKMHLVLVFSFFLMLSYTHIQLPSSQTSNILLPFSLKTRTATGEVK